MPDNENSKKEKKWQRLNHIIWLVWISTLAARLLQLPSKTDLNAKGPAVWVNIFFLILLYGYIIFVVFGTGRIILRYLDLNLRSLEFNVLAFMFGLAVFSCAILVIGLAGWLNNIAIICVLGIAGIISCPEWDKIRQGVRQRIKNIRFSPAKNLDEIILVIVLAFLLPVLFLNALSPAWDYDALLYHLKIPSLFLSQGKIYFDPDVFRSAYPFLGEMPFLVGLVFGVASLSKLINLTYAILLALSVYAFGKRFFGRETAVIAVMMLVGAPSITNWATWVSIDFAWAVYEFWSVYVVMLWLANGGKNTNQWLALAGILSGLAASTKYLSLAAMGIVGIIIAWQLQSRPRHSVVDTIKSLVVFGLSAGLVMSPWYIKNWLWTGNPIYPLVWGGVGWGPLKEQVMSDYLHSFGVGNNWLSYLLLPYNVYAKQNRFSTNFLEIIHPALWLAFAYPFLKQSKKQTVPLIYSALYCAIWAVNSQVIRFLLPASAFLALLAGDVIQKSLPVIRKTITYGLLSSLLLASLVYQILLFLSYVPYFIGQKSAADILRLSVDNFQITQYIQENLKPDERAQFLWDGRGYYCDARCIPDDEQSTAVLLAINSPSPETLAHELHLKGITHLMIYKTDALWFINYHDPHRLHQQALDYFEHTFLPACGNSVYKDGQMELFQITCP